MSRRLSAASTAVLIAGFLAGMSMSSQAVASPVDSSASQPAVTAVSADTATTLAAISAARDFNGDGRSDLALTGGAGWASGPVAFSNGNGTFNVTNDWLNDFPVWAAAPGVQAVSGDFNGDGRADVALAGGPGWATVPVAFSNGNGTFNITNHGLNEFPVWAAAPGVQAVSGDFNGDGRTDIALAGGPGWATVPVAFSNGNGTFRITNHGINDFPGWAATPGVKLV